MKFAITRSKGKTNFEKRAYLQAIALAVVCLVTMPGSQAKSKRKDKTPPTNVFTAPAEIEPTVPIFVNRDGTPLKPYDLEQGFANNPNLDMIRKLPSLTGDQRKQIDRLENDARTQRAALQDEVKSVQERLNSKKSQPQFAKVTGKKDHIVLANAPRTAAPPSQQATMDMQDASMEQMAPTMIEEVSEDSLKAKIDNSNLIIKGKNLELWQSVMRVLSDKQRDELDKMRKGQLMITVSASSQDLSSPPPQGNKPATTGGSPKGPVGEFVDIDKTVLKKIISNSPAQSVYNTLRSF